MDSENGQSLFNAKINRADKRNKAGTDHRPLLSGKRRKMGTLVINAEKRGKGRGQGRDIGRRVESRVVAQSWVDGSGIENERVDG